MARKRTAEIETAHPPRKKTTQKPRKVLYSPEQIREVADSIHRIAGAIEAVAKDMMARGIESLDVDGSNKPREGLSKIKVFVANAKKSLELY